MNYQGETYQLISLKVRRSSVESLLDLSPESSAFLLDSIERFVDRGIEKFCAGQKEHGGIIYERPMVEELENEVIDLTFYLAALKEKIKRKHDQL